MRKRLGWVIGIALGIGVLIISVWQLRTAPAAYGSPGDVISSFQVPPPDTPWTYRITQGLDYDGEYLLYLDDYSNSELSITPKICRLITSTGSVWRSFDAPAPDPANHKGLAWDGEHIWVSVAGSWAIYRTGSEAPPIITPNAYPYDLTYDSGYLYEVDGITKWVYKIEVANGSVASSFAGPSSTEEKCFGLANDGSYLYLGTYGRDDRIYRYTMGGSFVNSFPTPCEYPLGLAFDGSYLWCVDGATDYCYKFEK